MGKYEEALERAKQGLPMDEIFPELKHSEGERIGNVIYCIVRDNKKVKRILEGNGVSVDNALAYLERQKDETQRQFNLGMQAGREEVVYEMEKEQKPTESILQPTVKGKGVYKICPHCKERMIRDDSKVYTSIPPQYGYNCPKCGAMEFDTVMYDSPEMEEQKPAEWSEEDEENFKWFDKFFRAESIVLGGRDIPQDKYLWLKSLRHQFHWKPSKEQMKALNAINCHGAISYVGQQEHLISLYNDIKKL